MVAAAKKTAGRAKKATAAKPKRAAPKKAAKTIKKTVVRKTAVKKAKTTKAKAKSKATGVKRKAASTKTTKKKTAAPAKKAKKTTTKKAKKTTTKKASTKTAGDKPSAMSRAAFVAAWGSIFEHSPWVAERVFDRGVTARHNKAGGLHQAMWAEFNKATAAERLACLSIHPELAGSAHKAGELTASSSAEHAVAGLNQLTAAELKEFNSLNKRYRTKHGFPFIICLRDYPDKLLILSEFRQRLNNARAAELKAAGEQVRRITLMRLERALPK